LPISVIPQYVLVGHFPNDKVEHPDCWR